MSAARPFGLQPTAMRTKDGLVIYDFDQFFSTTMALAGVEGYEGDIDINNLPEGFKWVDISEVETFFNL